MLHLDNVLELGQALMGDIFAFPTAANWGLIRSSLRNTMFDRVWNTTVVLVSQERRNEDE